MTDLIIHDIMIKDVELIIFDKDGTIFELYPFWSKLCRRRSMFIMSQMGIDDVALESLITKSMGVDEVNRCMFREGPIGVHPRGHVMKVVLDVLLHNNYDACMEDIDIAFKKADEDINNDMELFEGMTFVPGVKEFLGRLDGRCQMAIYSGDITPRLEQVTRKYQIRHHFDALLGGDLALRPKPDRWGATHLMEELKVDPKNTIFIGDSASDMECGRNAGCQQVVAIRSDITDLSLVNSITSIIISDYREIRIVDRPEKD